MAKTFPVANLRDRTKDRARAARARAAAALEDLPRILGLANGDGAAGGSRSTPRGRSTCASGWRVSAARAF
jgi:hypothetical protein